ncbi:dUTP diphosphatase [Peribacillus glennii]|uniref:dUTPase n=1 Tax=Peribacillus glennii TaxID=2303991 RepID=A0A372LI35_9BACI|nr:dUTP diphosphatase [Peribacillus glennii]RFU65951.1 dUTPase [Peribacillus glennii]
MNLAKLFEMQAALDRHIETSHGLEKEDLVERKVLALLVELGELANETRCFKFWSVKGPSAEETILEEYVDGIHFILSLGIVRSFQEAVTDWDSEESTQKELTGQFLVLYDAINTYRMKQTREAYRRLFMEYINLGGMLGFGADKVETAYFEKNQVNFERQEQGY